MLTATEAKQIADKVNADKAADLAARAQNDAPLIIEYMDNEVITQANAGNTDVKIYTKSFRYCYSAGVTNPLVIAHFEGLGYTIEYVDTEDGKPVEASTYFTISCQ